MKKYILSFMLLMGVLFSNLSLAASNTLNTKDLSYTMGYRTGTAMKADNIIIDAQQYVSGLQAGLTHQKSRLSDSAMTTIMTTFQTQLLAKMQHKMQQQGIENTNLGANFLKDNAKKSNVVSLKSGLQYKILTAGKGASPTASDTVTVDYEGSLINGKIFDSSYKRGKSTTFPVNGVIPGWTQGLQLMKPGATWMLYIPAALAYGARGVPGIGPNQTLIFKVHLIKVSKAN